MISNVNNNFDHKIIINLDNVGTIVFRIVGSNLIL